MSLVQSAGNGERFSGFVFIAMRIASARGVCPRVARA
jgi:hypothetical protein